MRQGGDLDQDLTREVSGVGQNRDPPFFRAKVDPEAPLSSQELTELLQRSPLHVQSSIMKGVSNLLDSALLPLSYHSPSPCLNPPPPIGQAEDKGLSKGMGGELGGELGGAAKSRRAVMSN